MGTYEELMMKVVDGKKLTGIEREQMRQYASSFETNNQLVSSWQQINRKVSSSYLDLPISIIYSSSLVSNTASLNIEIPSDYTHLILMGAAKTDNAAYNDYLILTFNDDTSASYRAQYITGSLVVSAAQETSVNNTVLSTTTGASAGANALGGFFSIIPHYRSQVWKALIGLSGTGQWSSSTTPVSVINVGFWENTSTVKKITISPETGNNIVAGSTITVLGIK